MHPSLQKKALCIVFALLLFNQFSFGQIDNGLEIARKHIQDNLQQLKLTQQDIADFKVNDNYVSKHNGLQHIYLIQKHADIEVYKGMININILPSGKVLNMGNRFISDLKNRINTTTAQITAEQAVIKVIQEFDVETHTPFTLKEAERVSDKEIIFEHFGIALEPIKTKLVYQLMPNKTVRLAWRVGLYEQSANDWWNVRIDAVTGEVLTFDNQVIKCDFGSPEDICTEAHNHSHSPTTTTVLDDDVNNAYNVLPLFTESPNHGSRALITAPANNTASPFGWHDTDGVAGEEYTITRGNNVHAYQDIFSLNVSSGDEPDGGDSLVFDFPFDADSQFPYTQIDAAVTNLFYWNNLMHDIWYQYGFDEVSGNFQSNNYGNGGLEGDDVQAECLDGSGTNNANFGTAADGSGGRMQMFFWGSAQPPSGGGEVSATITVNQPEGVAGEYPITPGNFGAAFPSEDNAITSQVILVDDGVDPVTNGCEDLLNGSAIAGNIAMIDRGVCEFGTKCLAAQNAGAIAVIVCNNDPDGTIAMGPGANGATVNIPVMMLGQADCNSLKTVLADVELTFFDNASAPQIPNPGPAGIDGDFDNGIIAHEYGHGISIRLTGGPSTGGCLSNNEQMGEGWSDWFGLVLTTTSADNADEPRGIGTFAINEATTGTGIRTYPYSRNMAVNPHTYADINGESIPHGVGSIWCATLWDLYWNLVDEYGFDDDIYEGTGGNNIAMQLVIDGIKLQACDPTFIDGRDAILAADEANYDGANACLIWETFARRGIGVNAQDGGQQDFNAPVICSNAVSIKKVGPAAADVLDVITYTIEIQSGVEGLEEIAVTDILPANTSYVEGSASCGGTFEDGVLTLDVSGLSFGGTTTCTYDVQIEAGSYSQTSFEDGLENGLENWTTEGSSGATWTLNTSNPYNGSNAIYAQNIASESDQYFSIAESIVPTGANPSIGFWHYYDTEANWDGGVVELSVQGSTNWFDLGEYMSGQTYDSSLEENDASALSGREAFTGNSGGYVFTLIDLSLFTGLNVDIRFRFASDGFVGGDGWYIDDIQIFEDLVQIENMACIINQDDEEICSTAATTVFGVVSDINNTVNDNRVALYPNPTQSRFTVDVSGVSAQPAVLKVYSVDGRLLLSSNFNTADPLLTDMSQFGTGVYFAEIISDDIQTIRKVVVQ